MDKDKKLALKVRLDRTLYGRKSRLVDVYCCKSQQLMEQLSNGGKL